MANQGMDGIPLTLAHAGIEIINCLHGAPVHNAQAHIIIICSLSRIVSSKASHLTHAGHAKRAAMQPMQTRPAANLHCFSRMFTSSE